MSSIKSRVAKWDNTKAFLIILVVLGHAIGAFVDQSRILSNIYLWLTVFHMPLFMFLTGLFSKSFVNADKFNFSKIISYVLLYYFIKITIHFTLFFCRGEGNFTLFAEKGTPWYILATAVFMSFTYAVKKLKPETVLIISLCLSLFVGYIDYIGDQLILSRIFTFYPYFFLGYMMQRDKLLGFVNKKWVRFASCGIIVVFTAGIFIAGHKFFSLRYVFSGNNPYIEYGNDWYPLGAGLRLGCYILSSVIGLSVLSVMPNKNIPVFTNIGAKTLTVYSLHRQLLYVLHYTLLIDLTQNVSDLYMTLIFVAGSVLISVLLSLKPFEYVIYPFAKCEKWINPALKWFKK